MCGHWNVMSSGMKDTLMRVYWYRYIKCHFRSWLWVILKCTKRYARTLHIFVFRSIEQQFIYHIMPLPLLTGSSSKHFQRIKSPIFDKYRICCKLCAHGRRFWKAAIVYSRRPPKAGPLRKRHLRDLSIRCITFAPNRRAFPRQSPYRRQLTSCSAAGRPFRAISSGGRPCFARLTAGAAPMAANDTMIGHN